MGRGSSCIWISIEALSQLWAQAGSSEPSSILYTVTRFTIQSLME